MTSPFDWRGTPSQVRIVDTSNRAHRQGRGALNGRLSSNPTRQVAQCDLNGNIIKVYPSCASAARDHHMHPQCIHNCLKGHSKTAGGFKWKDYLKPMGSRNEREPA
jgi:hypothetical protein